MRKHSMQDILVFLIFSIFAILSVVLVAVGIKFYTNISNKVNDNSEMRSTIAYLENKLRSNDYDGGVNVVNIDGRSVLLLTSNIENNAKTAIYVDNGKLKEYLTIGDELKLGYGDTIANVDSMEVVKEGNMVGITLSYNDKDYLLQKVFYTGAL